MAAPPTKSAARLPGPGGLRISQEFADSPGLAQRSIQNTPEPGDPRRGLGRGLGRAQKLRRVGEESGEHRSHHGRNGKEAGGKDCGYLWGAMGRKPEGLLVCMLVRNGVRPTT